MSQKNNLIVTFADRNFIPQVKQLFAAAHFHGGWDGDYMVLTPDMTDEDMVWFKGKGIMVKVLPLPVDTGWLTVFPATIYLVFYIFTEEFKKWDQIVYLDVDILIRASLQPLTEVKGFAAVSDTLDQRLKHQFILKNVQQHDYSPSKYLGISKEEYQQKYNELKNEFNLSKPSFNAGVFALNTQVIKPDTFQALIDLAEQYGKIISFPPQGELNLLFYQNWQKLASFYNVFPFIWNKFYRINMNDLDGAILHFAGTFEGSFKPWESASPFYDEWKENLDKADAIDIKHPQPSKNIWSEGEIKRYEIKIHARKYIFGWYAKIDRMIGDLGSWLDKRFPRFYKFLKKYLK